MEDRHVIIHDLDTLYGLEYGPPHAYYAVFDGHAGTDAAVYSAAHLHQFMIQNPLYDKDPVAAIKHAFHITDTNFIKKAQKERLKGGTTAVVALIREKRLVVAWLGDSQALLVKKREPIRMVEPHKPEIPVERERVEEMGGCVINIQGTWRVLGQLAVSRAIGDSEYKPYVSSECDIKSLDIDGDEDMLILACDGLWDTLTPDQAVNIVYGYLTHNEGDTDGVGRCLVEAARSTGSEDNITAVVVFLRPVGTIMEEEATRINQGQIPEPLPTNLMKVSDAVPSSINAIFSPPINQFEMNTPPTPPTFNPFSPMEDDQGQHAQVSIGKDDFEMDQHQDYSTPTSRLFKGLEQSEDGTDAPGHDSDDDEHTPAHNKSNDAPEPSAEEVDAALAELDSIPDDLCDAEDDSGEEEEEEEWSYIRMDQQTHTQGEDNVTKSVSDMASEVASLGSAGELPKSPINDIHDFVPSYESKSPLESPLNPQAPEFSMMNPQAPEFSMTGSFYGTLPGGPASPMEAAPADFDNATPDFVPTNQNVDLASTVHNEPFVPMENQNNGYSDSPPHSPTSGSPPRTGSPRSVEGFVTSVDLNTPEESYSTNLAINQADPNFVVGGEVQQSSGPFSVYVSSSPEPSSLENPSTPPPTDVGSEDLLNMNGDKPIVEIVHAQSCVEVPSSPPPSDVIAPETHMDDHIASPTSDHMETEETHPISPSSDKEMETHPISPIISESNNFQTENLLDAPPISPSMPEEAKVESSSMEFTSTSNTMPVEEPHAYVLSDPFESEKPEPVSEPLVETIMEPIVESVKQEAIVEGSKFIEDFEPVEHRLESVEPRLESVEPRLESVEPRLESVEPRLESVEPRLESVEPRLESVEPRLESVEPRIESVEPQTAPVETQPELAPETPKEKPKSPVAEVKAKTPAKATPGKTTKTPASKTTPATSKAASTTKTKPTPSRTTPKAAPAPKAGTPTPTRAAASRSTAPKSSSAAAKSAAPKPTTMKPTAAKPSTTTRPTATKPAVSKPTTDKKPTTTRPASSTTTRPTATPRTTTTAPRSTTATATKRPMPSTTRPATKPMAGKTDGKMVNGTAKPTTTAPRKPAGSMTSSTMAKRPTTTPAPGTKKPTPTTTPASRSSAVAKETKNTTNRAVASKTAASTTTSRTTATAASRTTGTAASRTTATSRTTSATKAASSTTKSAVASRTVSSAKSATTMSRVNGTTTASKTTKTLSKTSTTAAKSSVGVKKSSVSKTSTASTKSEKVAVTSATEAETAETAELIVMNGENKIADEETSVEVKEKMEVEGFSTESHVTSSVSETITTSEISEKMMSETVASEELVAAEINTEVLVNGGDH
ncbi:unnamed protein product [Meganyctiphanes norvegica]|uniref:PPM-type phosphatase domain-containing protein n=1 Tax=Meganyctiphanes norvegica TaxID=48144 RepID=A0AAV2PR95_MEGNR